MNLSIPFLKQRRTRLLARIDELQADVDKLRDERADLKDKLRETKGELAEVKKQKQIEEEVIQHQIRQHMEKLDLQFDRRCVEEDRKTQNEIAKVKDQYRDKLEKQLEKRGDEIRGMYKEILERLPNVNMEITEKRQTRK